MADQTTPKRRSNAYQLFIVVLTVLSLTIMVALLLPLSQPTLDLLRFYDNVTCVIFLIDFFWSLLTATSRTGYFIGERGWLDLLGSVPALGFFRFTPLLRLARLSRLTRITRLLRDQNQKQLVADVIRNRGQYAAFVTLTLTLLVLTVASTFELQFESQSAEATITTPSDALWWSAVTITTVGYGDKYPVTIGGRLTAVFVMFTGVGIIGALASILSSVLVPPPVSELDLEQGPALAPAVASELAALRSELALIRQLLEREDSTRT